MRSWWRKVLAGGTKANRAGGPRLRAELLETRETPAALLAASVAAGNAPVVTVYDAATHAQKFTVTAYEAGFTGGVNVAVGDVDGDGTQDLITGAGAGGGPVVNVYSGTDGHLLKTFTVGDPDSRAGVSVAAADFDHDGKAELLLGAVQGGQPVVEVIRYADGTPLRILNPFPGAGSVSVAAGDVNGDGTPDIVAGAGAGGGPQVTVYDGSTGAVLMNAFAFEATFRGGVGVSAGDLNGDGKAEVVAGAGSTGGPRVVVYGGTTGTASQSFFAFDAATRNGVQAAAYDPGTGTPQIVTMVPGQAAAMRAFDARTLVSVTPPTMPGLPIGPAAVTTSSTPTTTGGSGSTTSGGTTTTPTTPTPTTPAAGDAGMVNALPPLDSPNWVTRADGLKVWDVQTGTGAAVTSGSTVSTYYTGWLTNGTQFDSSRTSPATFPLSGVIQGWREGLVGMQPGGIRRLYIPSALAYGTSGAGASIPPNSDLVFEVKLVSTT